MSCCQVTLYGLGDPVAQTCVKHGHPLLKFANLGCQQISCEDFREGLREAWCQGCQDGFAQCAQRDVSLACGSCEIQALERPSQKRNCSEVRRFYTELFTATMALDQTFEAVDSDLQQRGIETLSTEAATSPGGHASVCGRFDLGDSGPLHPLQHHPVAMLCGKAGQSKDGTLCPRAQRSCGLREGLSGSGRLFTETASSRAA